MDNKFMQRLIMAYLAKERPANNWPMVRNTTRGQRPQMRAIPSPAPKPWQR